MIRNKARHLRGRTQRLDAGAGDLERDDLATAHIKAHPRRIRHQRLDGRSFGSDVAQRDLSVPVAIANDRGDHLVIRYEVAGEHQNGRFRVDHLKRIIQQLFAAASDERRELGAHQIEGATQVAFSERVRSVFGIPKADIVAE